MAALTALWAEVGSAMSGVIVQLGLCVASDSICILGKYGQVVLILLVVGFLIDVVRNRGINKSWGYIVVGIAAVIFIFFVFFRVVAGSPDDGTPAVFTSEISNLIFQDDFSSPVARHWRLGNSINQGTIDNVQISGGVLRATSAFDGTIKWVRLYENAITNSYIEADDFDFSVNTRLLEPTTARDVWIAVHFRIASNFSNYALLINEKQEYAFVKIPFSGSILWSRSAAIRPLGDGNSLRVIADGLRFSIEINGTKILSTSDSSLQSAGGFALGVRANSGNAEVEFDNVLICEGICE